MRKNRYESVLDAENRLARNKVKVANKKIHLRDEIGIALWGAIDYLTSNGYVTVSR